MRPGDDEKARSTPARQVPPQVDRTLDVRKARTVTASGHATFATKTALRSFPPLVAIGEGHPLSASSSDGSTP